MNNNSTPPGFLRFLLFKNKPHLAARIASTVDSKNTDKSRIRPQTRCSNALVTREVVAHLNPDRGTNEPVQFGSELPDGG